MNNPESPITSIEVNFKRGGIIDSTLREGEQFGILIARNSEELPSVPLEFSQLEARNILRFLSMIGVDRAEVPTPMARGVEEYLRYIVDLKERPPVLAHVRNREEDIRKSIDIRVDGVNILTTVDPNRISDMGLSLSQYQDNLKSNIKLAKEAGMETRVGVEHGSLADFESMMSIYELADEAGVDRVNFADTLGAMTHWEVRQKIEAMTGRLKKATVSFHGHNDYLCGVANSMEALAAGAAWAETTVLGIGERMGITPLSSLMVRLHSVIPQVLEEKKYQLQHLKETDRYVSEIIGIPIPLNMPTAPTASTHKAGMHLQLLMKGPHNYEPFPPGLVGNERNIVEGSRISGKTSHADIEQFYNIYGRTD